MTDQDAQLLRSLVRRYSFATVCLELRRLAQGYARTAPSWHPVAECFTKAMFILSGGLSAKGRAA